jgi:NitT/TauT family transport system substrate-binding protein
MLDTLLTIHSIDTDTVEIVDLSPDEMFDALTGGQVDAVCTWNPHVAKLKSSPAEDATIFNGQGVYTETYNLVARQDFVRENSEVIPKVLRALVAARKFVQEHPQRAQRIVADRIGMDESRLAELWDIYHFSVELDEAFLSMLDSQARWAVRERLTDRQTLPDFGVLIYLDGLREVDPSLVSIQE